MIKKGTLYGVGVGPGDPELLTLKAHRIINETGYIAFPGKVKEETLAYQIVEPVLAEKENKTYISCPVVMTKDRAVLDKNYNLAAEKIAEVLAEGEDVAFLTLGDPTIYATYMYIHQRVEALGYHAEIINGIPSFCAAAARLDISISERADMIHVVPASYELKDALKLPGTKILMKSASKMGEVKEELIRHGAQTYMVENCCMENERVFRSAEEIDENAKYLSLIIVKE